MGGAFLPGGFQVKMHVRVRRGHHGHYLSIKRAPSLTSLSPSFVFQERKKGEELGQPSSYLPLPFLTFSRKGQKREGKCGGLPLTCLSHPFFLLRKGRREGGADPPLASLSPSFPFQGKGQKRRRGPSSSLPLSSLSPSFPFKEGMEREGDGILLTSLSPPSLPPSLPHEPWLRVAEPLCQPGLAPV